MMAETVEQVTARLSKDRERLTAENEKLTKENERLKAQVAAAGVAGRVATPQHTFQLSEGDRQELEIRGAINVGGRLMTKDDVQKAMRGAKAGQENVEIADAPDSTRVDVERLTRQLGDRAGVPGVDYVWPSVAPGQIDPAVAGTPGISGPAADKKN